MTIATAQYFTIEGSRMPQGYPSAYDYHFQSSPRTRPASSRALHTIHNGGYGAASPQTSMPSEPHPPSSESETSIHASVTHLLARAYSLPCSTSAVAFARLVPETARFQLALDELFPLLASGKVASDEIQEDVTQALRILVSYILYALYAPHSMELNPFRDVLVNTFVEERRRAATLPSDNGSSSTDDVKAGNEQLVWVLWKILKGDGNDIGPFSPSTLASSPLPPKLKAANLYLDFESPRFDISPASSPMLDSNASRHFEMTTSASTLFADKTPERKGLEVQAIDLLHQSRSRVLTLSESRTLLPLIPRILFDTVSPITKESRCIIVPHQDIPGIVRFNPNVAVPVIRTLILSFPSMGEFLMRETENVLVNVVEPSLNGFDVWGRLLKEEAMAERLAGDLLARFITRCIFVIDSWEREERERNWYDDDVSDAGSERFERGLRLFCRFYLSLLKSGVIRVSPIAPTGLNGSGSQTQGYGIYDGHDTMDTTEMTHFALRHSKFEDARTVYGILVGGQS